MRPSQRTLKGVDKKLDFRKSISNEAIQFEETARDFVLPPLYGNQLEAGSLTTTREVSEEDTVRSKTSNNLTVTDHIMRVWQKRKNELISYNDCLYRNIYTSHFVIPLDVDEIIVPRKHRSLLDFFTELKQASPQLLDDFASLSVRNAYFLRQFPQVQNKETVFFLKHIVRSDYSPKWESGKSFISTKNALTVFNHYALHVLRPGLRNTHFLPTDLVQMNHYRNTCSVNLLPECVKYLDSSVRITDTVITKYRKAFYSSYLWTLRQLGKLRPQ